MDLNDREEHRLFREEVRQFISSYRHLVPTETAFSYRLQPRPYSEDVLAWQKLLVKHGYAHRTVPKEYGGAGEEPDILKNQIISDEFFKESIPQGLTSQGISMLVPTLLEHGTEEQKAKWIKPTIEGDIFWCQGYSEPGSGSDLASLQTKAVEDGDDFLINGQKIWTSSATIAQMIFCLVRTEPDADKYQGISYLIFPMDTPGVDIRPLQTMTGHPSFNEVFFTDVRVPKSQVVGGRGKGWMVANSTLKHERGMLSNANGSLDRLLKIKKLLKAETWNGDCLGKDPLIRDRFIALQARVQAMRLHEMRMISEAEKGGARSLGDMICKLVGCQLNYELDCFAIDLMEDHGLNFDDDPSITSASYWQKQSMYDLGLIIGGGTAQIQKNIIAERGLDMPKEPRVKGA
ncbi:MAG: acyl-CoA dehydrogenase family protein [Sneathiellales bacterium]|nr:acyl-CoA dehydrogenase family protein [Sneathiellales bacterium]